MISRIFKGTVFPALAIMAVISFSGAASAADETNLTKFDVEQIVQNFIANNPKMILDSLSSYQKKNSPGSNKAASSDAVKLNKEALFNDPTSPYAGNAKGDVSIVEFVDYNCHFCKEALVTVQALIEKDDKLHVIFKDLPILGPPSEAAAKWALAAQKQKKYFEFHSAMMKNRSPITDELLEKVAKDIGLNVAQAKKDAESTDVELQIEKNRALAGSLGIGGTPAFVLGDQIISGAQPLSVMQQKISDQRKKK